ncbi:TlpA family protein disulfide reductase [Tuanshanicoccus lijuaniae]|uniref:TlpA family protein disulfide reductase n=1 Tax=Aerococcaceae bacterium zg-1292 TaxID=2774330 RepID=UPI00193518A7|nr:TlpA family protein disulfide reductase [Aerococcaceae bacterium zg-1292]MBF6625429.1 TlpA family protein disulfide reductase [Aerococcaceae bacterium zg-BR9]MBS4456339.1 TlpA family protein disulfide reductase [Aerococcaceae bacterium zg-A91]MBS4458245.1 TlpA family protein disulfide reductase [Aerococcaceae bacterium zg-BR33]QQA37152.1 TlpA family protein disulfide reductase [Aerococcaceae bacterium zg-1292]
MMKKLFLYCLGFVLLFMTAAFIYQRASDTTVSPLKTTNETNHSVTPQNETMSAVEDTITSITEETTTTNIIGPDTTFLDKAGNVLHLNDKKGRPMILNLWASWCPPCREEMPFFEKAYQMYQNDVEFIMLNAIGSRNTETKEAADSFLTEIGLDLPVYYDIDKNNQLMFGATIFPSTVFFDETGRAVKTIRGMLTEEQLITEIKALLSR